MDSNDLRQFPPGLDEDAANVIRQAESLRPVQDQTVEQTRAAYRASRLQMSSGGPEMAVVRDLITGGAGHPVPLRYYRPKGLDPAVPMPALIFCHGGGWVLGDLDTHDTACRILADASDVAVIAVDYRLSPEYKFPCALEDVLEAARWLSGSGAAELGIDPARLAIGGDSAGAVLATVTAIQARSLDMPAFRLQLLIYPAGDLRRGSRSQQMFKSGFLLTEAMQNWLTGLYLQDLAEAEDWRASPLLAADLSRLPPAWVLTAGFDPLRDEGLAYVTRLAEAGVAVTLRHYPGQIHGFITMSNVIRQAHDALSEAAQALRTIR